MAIDDGSISVSPIFLRHPSLVGRFFSQILSCLFFSLSSIFLSFSSSLKVKIFSSGGNSYCVSIGENLGSEDYASPYFVSEAWFTSDCNNNYQCLCQFPSNADQTYIDNIPQLSSENYLFPLYSTYCGLFTANFEVGLSYGAEVVLGLMVISVFVTIFIFRKQWLLPSVIGTNRKRIPIITGNNGQSFVIHCPNAASGGSELSITSPISGRILSVIVPTNILPGEYFIVEECLENTSTGRNILATETVEEERRGSGLWFFLTRWFCIETESSYALNEDQHDDGAWYTMLRSDPRSGIYYHNYN